MNASFSTREQLGQLMMFSVDQPVIDDAPHAAGRDVGENLPARRDLLAFAGVGHGERNADRVADPAADELLERDPRLDDAVGRQPGLGHAQVQRHIGPLLGEAAVDLDHLRRVGILQRHAISRKADRIQKVAMLPRAFQHRRDRIVGGVLEPLCRDRPSRN